MVGDADKVVRFEAGAEFLFAVVGDADAVYEDVFDVDGAVEGEAAADRHAAQREGESFAGEFDPNVPEFLFDFETGIEVEDRFVDQHAGIDGAIQHGLFDLEEVHVDRAGIGIVDPKEHGVGGVLTREGDFEASLEGLAFALDEFGAVPFAEAYRRTQQGVVVPDERVHSETDGTDIVGAFEGFDVERLNIQTDVVEGKPTGIDPSEGNRIVHKDVIGIRRVCQRDCV